MELQRLPSIEIQSTFGAPALDVQETRGVSAWMKQGHRGQTRACCRRALVTILKTDTASWLRSVARSHSRRVTEREVLA
jgi:hypothetical protein